MTIRRITFVLLLLAIAVTGAVAQELVVEYVEGYLELRDSGSWYELYIGDVVDRDDVIRLDEGAYAELSDGLVTIRLTRAATYEMEDLLDSVQNQQRANIGSLVANRLGRMTNSDDRGATTVGGVRASEAATEDRLQWAGGADVDELVEEGIRMLDEGDYLEAFYIFEEAYEYSSFEEEGDFLFLMGYALALEGDVGEALSYYEDAALEPDSEYYDDYMMAYAQLLIETFAFEDAVALLEEYVEESEDDYDRQYGYLLLGIAFDGAGDADASEAALEEAADIDADGDITNAAMAMLES